MANDTVVLIYPPLIEYGYRYIYLSLPLLAACLKQHGFGVKQVDLNNEFIRWFLKSDVFRHEMSMARKRRGELGKKRSLSENEYQQYTRAETLDECFAVIRKYYFRRETYVRELLGTLDLALPRPPLRTDIKSVLRSHNRILDLMRKFYEERIASIGEKNPLFVGISAAMIPQIVPSLLLTRLIKRHLGKSVKVFWGGPAMSLSDDDTFQLILKYGMADGIVKYEGEEAVVEIAKILKEQRKGKDISFETVPNLVYMKGLRIAKSEIKPKKHISEYPLPHYDRQMLRKCGDFSSISLLLSRGCRWGKCAFCEYPRMCDRKQLIEADKVVDNMIHLTSRYPGRPVWLLYDMMTPEYMREFCTSIVKRGARFRWEGFIRADKRYSSADLELLKRAGCYFVDVGIESLDTKVLKLINKGYATNEAVSFLRKLLKSGIEAQINMIVNLPGTTYRSAYGQYTILKELLEEAAKDRVLHFVAAGPLGVSKNAPFGICPEKYGIKLAIPKGNKVSDYMYYLPYLNSQDMSLKKIGRICDLYSELNISLEMMRSNDLHNRKKLSPTDRLQCQRSSVMTHNHLFDHDGNDRKHHRVLHPFIRVRNLKNGLWTIIPNADLVRWIFKRLPIGFSDLKKVFREEAPLPFRMDETKLIDTLDSLTSIGVITI